MGDSAEPPARTGAAAPRELLIGGSWREASGGRRFAVDDPASGQMIAEVADAGSEDALAALQAAADAGSDWAASAPRRRAEILYRARELMLAERDRLAALMTGEMGKTLAESRGEISYAAEYFRWFAEEAVRVHGRYMADPNGGSRLLTMRQPVGPCLLITPWNFPAAMAARKVAPAIAAGCTAIVKPAQQTPLSMLALAELLIEAGLPAGVLNVLTTSDAAAVSDALLVDRRLRKLSFTGSTDVGRALMARSAGRLLRISMELGGNAPFIVFDDADLGAAIEGAMVAKMRNIGEACTAANRFLVQRSSAESFATALAARMSALRCGPGAEPKSEVGPLISEAQRAKVAGLVDDALRQGARLLCGGERLPGPGYFFAPTVLADVPPQARIAREEIFGPVAAVYAFDDERQAIAIANESEHGLAAYLFTADINRAMRVAEAIECGMVGINQGMVSNPAAPFGGIKQSGFGREGGFEGIGEYLAEKLLVVSAAG